MGGRVSKAKVQASSTDQQPVIKVDNIEAGANIPPNELTKKYDELRGNIISLSNMMADNKQKLQMCQNSKTVVENSISLLRTSVDNLNSSIKTKSSDYDALKKEKDKLISDYQTKMNDIAAKDAAYSALYNAKAAMKQEYDTKLTQFANLDATLQQYKNDIRDLETAKTTLQGQLTANVSQLNAKNTEIANLNANITMLNNRLASAITSCPSCPNTPTVVENCLALPMPDDINKANYKYTSGYIYMKEIDSISGNPTGNVIRKCVKFARTGTTETDATYIFTTSAYTGGNEYFGNIKDTSTSFLPLIFVIMFLYLIFGNKN